MTAEEAMVKAKAAAYEYDWAGSEREFRRALALNPSYAYAHDQFGLALALQGRVDEGLGESRRAVELDPLAPEILSDLSMVLGFERDFEAARTQARRIDELDPSLFLSQAALGWIDIEEGKNDDAILTLQKAVAMDAPSWVSAWLGWAYGASGDHARGSETLSALKEKSRRGDVPPDLLGIVYVGMGDRERALDELERAYAAHSQLLTFLGMDRMFDSIRSEPRFVALAKKVGFES